MSKTIDMVFPVSGKSLPWDHSYALFGALSRVQPLIHEGELGLGVFPVNGLAGGGRTLKLTDKSVLRLRVPTHLMADLMCLLGSTLELDGHRIKLGNPQIEPIQATPRLFSPWVTLKDAEDPESFTERASAELDKLGVSATLGLVRPQNTDSKDGGKGTRDPFVRRTRTIKGRAIVGFALLAEGLSAEDSSKLQAVGLGGRRHFGGGLFRPVKGR